MDTRQTVTLFDTFCLTVPKELTVHQDGIPGQRVLFLTDKEEIFVISFEEEMQAMDMLPVNHSVENNTASYQCCKDGKYIHLRWTSNRVGSHAFFHIELEDREGRTLSLPGQITANSAYSRSDGIDPILLELIDGLTLL